MRIAVAGKGGAGKTTISATLSRLVASKGTPVVAIDADSNPNLASALGMGADGVRSTALPPSLVSRRLDGPALAGEVAEVLRSHATTGPDGLKLVVMGAPDHAEQGCLCASHAVVSAMLADLGSYQDWTVVVDLEASPEHMSRGTARNVDVLILVAEPYYRSLAAVGRLAVLATELPIPRVAVVLNKVRGPEDALAMGEFCINHGLECLGELPWSEEILGADRAGVCLFDYMPDGEVVTAVSSLVDRLETVSGTREGSVSMSAQAVI